MQLISRSDIAREYRWIRHDAFKAVLDSPDFPKPVKITTSQAGKTIRYYDFKQVGKYFEKYPRRRKPRKINAKPRKDETDYGVGGKDALKNPTLAKTVEFYQLISGRRKPSVLEQSQQFMRSIAR